MKRWLLYFWGLIAVGNRERERRFLEDLAQDFEQDIEYYRTVDAALAHIAERMEVNLAKLARLEEDNKDV